MGVLVHLGGMSGVLMFVRAMFARVRVRVVRFLPRVLMGMRVFVVVPVGVDVRMFVGVLSNSRMLMLVFMFVHMLVGVLMMVFVVAFHGYPPFVQIYIQKNFNVKRHNKYIDAKQGGTITSNLPRKESLPPHVGMPEAQFRGTKPRVHLPWPNPTFRPRPTARSAT
jgi:hypothetical protein